MKVKFRNSKKLLRVLSTAENILKKNKSDNKLQYLKLENVNGKLCIIAKNPYMQLGYYVEDLISIEGDSALYEYKTLISLLNVLDDEIEIDDNKIKNKKCNYTIPVIDINDYPEESTPEAMNKKEINTKEFISGLEKVFCAVQKNEYESVLTGVYVNGNELVACDSNRLFMHELEKELDKVILSRDLVSELLRLPFNEKINMSIFGNKVIFEDDNIYIDCNFIAGDYPKYKQLLPQKFINEIYFNKKDLEEALNLIMPVIDINRNNCKLDIGQNDMLVYIENEQKGAETVIPIDVKNELNGNIKTMFNINYLFDMLKSNKDSITMLIAEGSNEGFMFTSEKAKQYIMTMRN